jgi:hypothetical protein
MRVTLAAVLLSTACVTVHRPSYVKPAAEREWNSVLALAQQRAAAASFDAADSILADFATRNRGTSQALETTYWRAVLKLDPTNKNASVPMALSSLDAYLADARPREHVAEAAALRHIGAQLDAINRLVASTQAQAAGANTTSPRVETRGGEVTSTEAEVKRLKDELAKANAELDRIRKRLAQPPKH